MPEAKLIEIKVVLYLGSEATIAGELGNSGAEKDAQGCLRVLAWQERIWGQMKGGVKSYSPR